MTPIAMSAAGNIKLYDIFRKDLHLPDEKALELVQAMEEAHDDRHALKLEPRLAAIEEGIRSLKASFDTLEDRFVTKVEFYKAIEAVNTRIYVMGVAQFVAIVGSVLAIMKFMR